MPIILIILTGSQEEQMSEEAAAEHTRDKNNVVGVFAPEEGMLWAHRRHPAVKVKTGTYTQRRESWSVEKHRGSHSLSW